MSNSKNKMDVVVTKTEWDNGKEWVKVTLKKYRSFFPSFEDLYRIVQAICFCEDRKYPNGKGRKMVCEFLADACYMEWDEVAKKYEIPNREPPDA